jgi:peptide/nickel transport system permease protein
MIEENERALNNSRRNNARKKALKRFFRAFVGRKIVLFGMIVLLLFIIVSAFAPLLAPYDPYKPDMVNILSAPSSDHLLGTDTLGRDILSRMIYGSRNSLIVGLVAVGFAAVIGMVLGLISGYYGGFIDMIIMRFMDAIMSIPTVLLAVTIASVLGGGITNVIIAIGVALIPSYARLMRSQVLVIKQNDYIIASVADGALDFRIMFNHISPNSFPPLIVLITMQVGHAILSEASLSFLGVGITPPNAAWGSMVSTGYNHLLEAPVLSIAPGLAIMLVVFAYNMVGDGLRDALDPRLRGSL